MKTKEAAEDFLAQRRIAVTGVSRSQGHGANVVYQRLRERGYDVVAINPQASEVEGDPCYPDLRSVPGAVDAVVIGTRADRAEATVRECAELGITKVWMHHGMGGSSVSREATEWGRAHGLTVIDGGCPCMFGEASDGFHRCARVLLSATGRVPHTV